MLSLQSFFPRDTVLLEDELRDLRKSGSRTFVAWVEVESIKLVLDGAYRFEVSPSLLGVSLFLYHFYIQYNLSLSLLRRLFRTQNDAHEHYPFARLLVHGGYGCAVMAVPSGRQLCRPMMDKSTRRSYLCCVACSVSIQKGIFMACGPGICCFLICTAPTGTRPFGGSGPLYDKFVQDWRRLSDRFSLNLPTFPPYFAAVRYTLHAYSYTLC